jgi:hypothetical protein
VIFPESLDATCRALLRRGQSAIDTIARSEVRAAGLLGNPIDDATLRQHEWEIAVKLREITSLRAMLAAQKLTASHDDAAPYAARWRHRRAALGYRTSGNDAAAFRILLSGIHTTPGRPPGIAFAADFGGLMLARRRWRRG